jgi:hypothetical protein
MSLPVIVLFYFWITQKSHISLPFSDAMIEKLRARDDTMGLRARNVLFFVASVLIVFALSGPMWKGEKIDSASQAQIVALDVSVQTQEEFEATKRVTMEIIRQSSGTVELVAYDEKIYRIAPSSNDKATLSALIKGLSFNTIQTLNAHKSLVLEKLPKELLYVISKGKSQEIKPKEERWILYPLFYVPLGFAIVCIVIALSSMSKRQSVTIALVCMMGFPASKVEAGVMDFRILHEAYDTYEAGQYTKSTQLFRAYQRLHDSPQVRYNLANAYVKAGDIKQARFWYEHVYTTDAKLQNQTQYNLSLLPSKVTNETKTRVQQHVNRPSLVQTKERILKNATPLFAY